MKLKLSLRVSIVVIACVLVPTRTFGDDFPTGLGLITRVTAEVGPARFRLDIKDVWISTHVALTEIGNHRLKHPGWLPVRVLTIDCDAGCSRPVKMREETIDGALSAFRLSDKSNQLITIWVGGSAYHIKIYELSASGISKVLDEGSLSAPQFINSSTGNPSILLDNSFSQHSTTVPVKGTRWVWTGSSYQVK